MFGYVAKSLKINNYQIIAKKANIVAPCAQTLKQWSTLNWDPVLIDSFIKSMTNAYWQ